MNRKIDSVWNSLTDYKLNSIFFKYFILTFLIIIVPFSSIGAGIYIYAGKNAEKQIIEAYERSLLRIKDTVEFIISENDKLAINFSSDSDVIKFLSVYGDDYRNYEMLQVIRNVTIKASFSPSEYVDSIYIYSKRSNLLMSTNQDFFGKFEEFGDDGWYKAYNEKPDPVGRLFLFRQVKLGPSYNNQKGTMNYLTFVQKIPMTGGEDLGFLVVNVDVSKFNNFFGEMLAGEDEDVFIIDQADNIMYNGSLSLIGKNISEIPFLKKARDTGGTQRIFNEKGGRKFVSIVESRYGGYKFASIIPVNQALNTSSLRNILIYSVAASVLLSLILSLLISIRMYKPFGDIISMINDPEKIRNSGFGGPRKGYNELKYILSKIVDINLNRKNMELSLAEYLTMLKKAQTVALQSQINPHFLYNTLSAINWLTIKLTNSENEASQALTNLSDLLRLSLETEDSLTRIKDEITHAKKYIEIEKLRFKNLFELAWEIDEEVNDYMTVKITLQPIIENAIYHGLKQRKSKGLITIRSYLEKETIAFEVEDNGAGMDSRLLESINLGLENDYIKEDQNIGLRNVNQRIKLIFGGDYGAKVYSVLNEGTKVKIIIPKVKNRDHLNGMQKHFLGK